MAEIPDRLGAALSDRYVLERELGQGGMATVYLAQDVRHDRRVALKVLKPELAAIVGGERFLVEIKTTANLHHPHILPLFDSGETDGFLYYVMPFVEGESLQDRLDREKQLPVSEAIAITSKVAGALQAAHDKGIIHRDIKPANILLANGEPLVADFGIALAVQQAGGGRLTETGLSLGTPYYMSPEQATADRDPDARADVYSLGCVLYEMLAGEPPFPGTTAQAILGRILTQAPPSVTALRAMVPPHVDAAIIHALQKLPADRFETAEAFAKALGDPGRTSGRWDAPASGSGANGAHRASRGLPAFVPWGVAAAALVVASATLVRSPAPPAADPIRFALPTAVADLSWRTALAISTDGREIVMVGIEDGVTHLQRRSMGSTEVRDIPGTEGAESPAVSPDGRWVAFAADGVVKRVSLDGGAPVVMAHTPNLPIGIAWSDANTLVMGMMSFSSQYPGLTTVQIGDTTVRQVTLPRGDTTANDFGMHHEPFSIGGGAVLFIDFSATDGLGIGVASLADGKTHRVDLKGAQVRGQSSIVGVADGFLLFIDNGDQLMAVGWDPKARQAVGEPFPVPGVSGEVAQAVLAADGTLVMTFQARSYRVALVDDRGAELQAVGDPGIEYVVPRFTPDGRRAALAGGPYRGVEELWTYDFESGLLSQLSIGFAPRMVDWSPTGARVLVGDDSRWGESGEERVSQLWTRAADASDDPTLLRTIPGMLVASVAWSPDGNTIAMVDDVGPYPSLAKYDVVTMRLDGDTTVVPFAAGEANEVAPRFSPDGRWLAYGSNESGRYQVYVRPFPGPGPRIQVSDDGGGQPTWSRDGRRIFYTSGRAMMVANLETDPRSPSLSVASRARLFEADFLGGPDSPVTTYDVNPDGRRFLLARAEDDARDRTVVWTNWMDELQVAAGAGGR
ncbi:MAG TPA: protein kinase [Longimicrobiales bacterium]|nr:protein kinase [Longimicrobiales bacterium]